MKSRVFDTLFPDLGLRPIKPRPEDYGLRGLFSNFDVDDYIERKDTKNARIERFVIILSFLLTYSLISIYIYKYSDNLLEVFFGSLFPAIFICFMGVQPILSWVHEKFCGGYSEPHVEPYVEAVLAYREAEQDWIDRHAETGRSYWRALRGIALEQATKSLLVRRGCVVAETKITGDGGVDLVVSLEKSVFWCQCKGLASPVGVATVREIAGVCSRNDFSPVVIAVNGYTKSAVCTAKDLGVILVDTENLVRMARESVITKWL